ncbi:50S ribosomal protein L44e [Candidatus Woesearchaeota archaeon]|nr:50S ribosomal protein L44e [Candidatus Woesearchaeota archaeon]
MKIPKTKKMYCKKCKAHTDHAIAHAKKKERGSLKKGSIARAHKRGRGVGHGNLGKWGSKPAVSKWKRAGVKSSKKTDFRYKCAKCGKSSIMGKGIRAKKVEFE